MSMETEAFQDELDKINDAAKEMKKATDEFKDCITSEKFLDDQRNFEKLSFEAQNRLVTIAEETQPVNPQSPLPQYMPQGMDGIVPRQSMGNQQSLMGMNNMGMPGGMGNALSNNAKHFSWSKTAVAIAIVVICGVLVAIQQPIYDDRGYQLGQASMLPVTWFIAILIGCIVFVFFDSLWRIVQDFLFQKTADKQLSHANKLDEWIVETFNTMRNKYTSAVMLIQIQTSSKASMPDYALPDTSEAIYNRKQFFETTLRSEFLNGLGAVMQSCNKNVWSRRIELNRLISQTKASSAGAHT